MTTVLLVDDQMLVRTGFRLILEFEPDMTVVGEAADGREALRLAATEHPDVILMDIRMPVLDGVEATRQITAAGSTARVLVLTTFDLDEYVYEAMRAGASGFLLKDAPREQLVAGVRMVARGDTMLASSVTRRLIERFARKPAVPASLPRQFQLLSDREREVLILLCRGFTNAEIAQCLLLGEATVKTYVARLLVKLEVRDRIQAVIRSYESGFIELGESSN